MNKQLKAELDKIKTEGLYRELKVVSCFNGKEMIFNGKKYLNFSSNNYLGLAEHPQVKKAAIEAIEKYGCGGTSSRLICGTSDIHKALEEKLALLKSKEKALVFPSGFAANLGIIAPLLGEGDCLIIDKLNHASLWDAAKLSKARLFIYEHTDMASLEKVLKRAQSYKKKLVACESVFSMDGDLSPLKDIVFLAKKYNALTMIDEAHATGIFGKHGRGLAEFYAVENDIDIVMGTLSKALGSQGGFVCASTEIIDYLINKSRSFIYTTALAPSCAAAALKALEIAEQEPGLRKTLLSNSLYLRTELTSLGFDIFNSQSQIIPVLTGSVKRTLEISSKFLEKGIFVPAIRPPTVPEGKCRLRFSLTSRHTMEDLKNLLDVLKGIL